MEDSERRVLQKRRLSLERAQSTSFSQLSGHHAAFGSFNPTQDPLNGWDQELEEVTGSSFTVVPDVVDERVGGEEVEVLQSDEEVLEMRSPPSLVDVDAVLLNDEENDIHEKKDGGRHGIPNPTTRMKKVLDAKATRKSAIQTGAQEERPSRFRDRIKAKKFCCVPHFVANISQKVEMLSDNTQMILCSGGTHIIAVLAALLVQAWVREGPNGGKVMQESGNMSSSSSSMYYYGGARIMCVVIPDGMPPSVLNEIASPLETAIKAEIKRVQTLTSTTTGKPSLETLPSMVCPMVFPMTEGLGTKERCAIYQQGGVVVGAGRVLCADILHKRLSPSLTVMNIFLLSRSVVQADYARQASGALASGGGGSSLGRKSRLRSAATNSFAFFIDLINDGKKCFTVPPSPETVDRHHVVTYEDEPMNKKSSDFAFGTVSITPSSIILCDEPVLLQNLVQRHHRGLPHFTQQMRVGDIQIFPRFRLEIIQHYERVGTQEAQVESALRRSGHPGSKARRAEDTEDRSPFRVDRIQVPPSPTTVLLDQLLVKVLKEIWSELQLLHERWNRARDSESNSKTGSGAYRNTGQFRQRTAQLLDEVNGSRFLPRSLSVQAINPSRPVNSYIRKVWRDPADPSGFRFDWMPEEVAIDVSQVDLDEDLSAALRLNRGSSKNTRCDNSPGWEEDEWPYRVLVESLLDVRQLRRDAQDLTPYAFLWSLEQALRLRRQRSAMSAAATAAWTLSSSFFDILTVATERIGSVVWQDIPAPYEDEHSPPQASIPTAEVNGSETIDAEETENVGMENPGLLLPNAATTVKQQNTNPKKCTVIEIMDVDEEEDVQIIESNVSADDPSLHNKGIADGLSSSSSKNATDDTARSRRAEKRLVFAPNMQHALDPVLEILMTMTSSWCRGVFRKASESKNRRATGAPIHTDAHCTSPACLVPDREGGDVRGALLIVCFGRGAVLRAVQRLSYGKDGYQQLQLNQFLQLYQLYHRKHHERGECGSLSVSTSTGGEQVEEENNEYRNNNRKRKAASTGGKNAPPIKQEPGSVPTPVDSKIAARSAVDEGIDGLKRSDAIDEKSLPPALLREQLWHFNTIASDLQIVDVKEEPIDTTVSTQRPSPHLGGKKKMNTRGKNRTKQTGNTDSHAEVEDERDDDEGSAISDEDDMEQLLERSLGMDNDSADDHCFLFSQAAAPPSLHSGAGTHSLNGAPATQPPPSLHEILLSQTLAPLPALPEAHGGNDSQPVGKGRAWERQVELDEIKEKKFVEKADGSKCAAPDHFVVDDRDTEVEERVMGDSQRQLGEKVSTVEDVGVRSTSSETAGGRAAPIRFDILQWSPSLSVVAARPGSITNTALHIDESIKNDACTERGSTGLLIFINGDTVDECTIDSWLRGTHPVLTRFAAPSAPSNANLKQETRSNPIIRDVLLTTPNVAVLRMLETVLHDPHSSPSFSPLCGGKTIRVRLLTTPLAEEKFNLEVKAEREAFESLAHAKATLTSTLLADRDSMRETAIALESGLTLSRRSRRTPAFPGRLGGTFFEGAAASLGEHKENPRVIFDDREFRASLPYSLHSVGLDLVPLTLITADYVLSPDYAIERKSIPDYLHSLQSGRLAKQLAAMTRQYAHPICLIEFALGEPFRLLQSSSQAFARNIFVRTGKLIAKFPKVLFMWARNPLHAAGMVLRLKQTVAKENVDPSAPHLTMSAVALQEYHDDTGYEAGETQRSNASREAALAAGKVLSCFPGINPSNANGVMQLCGSLMGLATVSKDSLLQVMTPEDADKLYTFLHKPFVEEIE